MDVNGQKTGGINSNGTNLVPGSDFSVPQNAPHAADNAAQDNSKFQPSGAGHEQLFPVQNSAHTGSNVDNNTNDVATNTSDNSLAEDGDLIEKEWVLKAKTIVENTQNNPFLQSQKLAELRTDYLQKRYGKSLQEDD